VPQAAAEIARTLADGYLPGHLTLAAPPGDIPVRHLTTADGQVLVLAQPGSRAWRALIAAGEDEPAVLTVDDIPPFPEAPWLGRVHVCGWLQRVEDSDWPQDAVAFAATSPLTTVGGLGLFRVEVGEVWLDQPESVVLEPEEFAVARADPLHADERSLLLDLRQHHLGELAALVPGLPDQCLPVRLDRYGLVLADGPRLYRVDFPAPVDCPGCVAHALRLSHVGHP
jgi:hypothetical protein